MGINKFFFKEEYEDKRTENRKSLYFLFLMIISVFIYTCSLNYIGNTNNIYKNHNIEFLVKHVNYDNGTIIVNHDKFGDFKFEKEKLKNYFIDKSDEDKLIVNLKVNYKELYDHALNRTKLDLFKHNLGVYKNISTMPEIPEWQAGLVYLILIILTFMYEVKFKDNEPGLFTALLTIMSGILLIMWPNI